MAKHRTRPTHSTAFKRRVVEEYLAGEPLHGLARRHDLSRTLIRIRVDKDEAGAFDEGSGAGGASLPGRLGPGSRPEYFAFVFTNRLF